MDIFSRPVLPPKLTLPARRQEERWHTWLAGSVTGALLGPLLLIAAKYFGSLWTGSASAYLLAMGLGTAGGWLAGAGYFHTRRQTLALRQQEQLCHTLLEYAPDAIALCQDSTLLWLNPAGRMLLGITDIPLLPGKTLADFVSPGNHLLLSGYTTQIRQGVYEPAWIGITLVRSDQNPVEARLHLAEFKLPPHPPLLLATIRDLKDYRAVEERLEYVTHHDALTGLPNRILFIAHLQYLIEHSSQRTNPRLTVLWINLDRFKHINNTLGHNAGDTLLKEAACRINITLGSCKRKFMVARPGGDEFALILEKLPDLQYAALIAQNILEAFAAPLKLDKHDIILSAAIGISTYPEDGEDCETLLQSANSALQRAKQEGGGNYQFHAPDRQAGRHDTIILGNSMKRALEDHEFVLYYQPQVAITDRQITGAEALLRWQHPERGLISPAKFIPYAEETGFINPLSEWAMRTACQQNKVWQSLGLPPIRIGINLTARQIAEENTIEKITAILHESRLPPQWLKLEVTESFIIQNPEQAILNMRALKKLGVSLSIDDFGTGYSSFSYLKELPVDELKIDRAFIKDLPGEERDGKITAAMIAIGHSLQLKVVAEGVETEAQLDFLEEQSCDLIQGHLFSPPVPGTEFVKLFKANFWQPV